MQPRRGLLRRLIGRPEFLVFVVVYGSSAFFSEIAYQTSNYTARLFLTQAMVDQRSFRLDRYRPQLGVDHAYYAGHYYSDKPPGSSIMMLPQYLLLGKPVRLVLRAIGLEKRADLAVAWLVQVSSLSVYTALGSVALYRLLALFGAQRRRIFLTVVCFFGTLMFPWSTVGTGEMFTAPVLLWAVYLLLRGKAQRDLFCSGLLFGLACLTTYQVALVALVVLTFVLSTGPSLRCSALFALPLVVSAMLALIYNLICFGSASSFPTHHFASGAAPTLVCEVPTAKKLLDMLFLPWKGLFFYSPFLVLASVGYWRMARAGLAAPAGMLVSCFLAYFLFLSFNKGWHGGSDYGFRYIVPALPFLCIGAAVYLSKERFTVLELILVIWSVCLCSFGAITDPHVTGGSRMPMLEYNLEYFLANATNNVVNQLVQLLFGLDAWLFRLATTALFFCALAGLASVYGRCSPVQK